MALETALADITEQLRQGSPMNRQSLWVLFFVCFRSWAGILGTPAVVWPEYQTGEGRADFALCHPPSKPAVLIEVKQPGRAEEGVHQALEYAFHTGVPFIVLTDGNTWSFYLPAEQGSYEDRRVYKLDLFERSPGESAEALSRYLGSARVESGAALETARQEPHAVPSRASSCGHLEAWRELVEKGDQDLVDLLADAAELKAGVPPDHDDVEQFLATLKTPPCLLKARGFQAGEIPMVASSNCH